MSVAEILRKAQAALKGGRLEEAGGLAMDAIEAARSRQEAGMEAGALVVLGQTLLQQGDPGRAAGFFEEALRLLEGRGDAADIVVVKQAIEVARGQAAAKDPRVALNAAMQAMASGSPEEALSVIRAALPGFEEDREALCMARAVEARALQRMGHHEEALRILGEALATATEAGLMDHVDGLRNLERRLRQTVGLRRVAAMSVEELGQSTQDPAKLSALLMQKALSAVAERDREEARRLLDLGMAKAVESGAPVARLQALVNAAQIYGAMGDAALARERLSEARPLAEAHAPAVIKAIEEIERGLKS